MVKVIVEVAHINRTAAVFAIAHLGILAHVSISFEEENHSISYALSLPQARRLASHIRKYISLSSNVSPHYTEENKFWDSPLICGQEEGECCSGKGRYPIHGLSVNYRSSPEGLQEGWHNWIVSDLNDLNRIERELEQAVMVIQELAPKPFGTAV